MIQRQLMELQHSSWHNIMLLLRQLNPGSCWQQELAVLSLFLWLFVNNNFSLHKTYNYLILHQDAMALQKAGSEKRSASKDIAGTGNRIRYRSLCFILTLTISWRSSHSLCFRVCLHKRSWLSLFFVYKWWNPLFTYFLLYFLKGNIT